MNDKGKARELLDGFLQKIGRAKEENFSFLLIGRTGVGKSSSVNSLMGKEIAPTNDDEPETMEVTVYESESFGVKFNVIDTPGLCDDLEEVGNDEIYIDKIINGIEKFDSMWFVTALHDTRVSSDEKRAIKIISKAFTEKVWEHAVIIFTFSNYVPADEFEKKLAKRTEKIKEEIAKYAKSKIVTSIPAVAIDNRKETNPDGKEWLGELYTTVFERISDKGALPFLMATAEMVNANSAVDEITNTDGAIDQVVNEEGKINLTKEQKHRLEKKIDASVIGGLAVTGAAVGSLLGPVGAALGAAAGATIGLIAWLKE